MSTSLYLNLDPCPTCGRGDDQIHVGQSASGFHGYLMGDPQLPGWWKEQIGSPHDWARFVAVAVLDHGATWWDDNGGHAAASDNPLAEIGHGDQQARWFVSHPEVRMFRAAKKSRGDGGFWLPEWDRASGDRWWWTADGFVFTTGSWS